LVADILLKGMATEMFPFAVGERANSNVNEAMELPPKLRAGDPVKM
jgi:hypothetical protein